MLTPLTATLTRWLLQPFALVLATMDSLDEVWEPFLVEDDRVEMERFGARD